MAHQIIHRAAVLGGGNPLQFDGITSYRWSVQDLSALADGSDVTAWTDRHSGVLMTQRSEGIALPPSYIANAGDPYVDFSGDDFLYSASVELGAPTPVASSDFSGGFTAFLVMTPSSALLSGAFAYGDRTTRGGSYPDMVEYTTAGAQIYYTGGTAGKLYLVTNRDVGSDNLVPTTLSDVQQIVCRRANGPSTPRFSYFTNGVKSAEGDGSGTGDPRPQTTGRQMAIGQGYSELFIGQIREVVLYEATLTDEQVSEVFSTLNSIYSVY